MKTYISMLRGINVSGQKKINMDDLKKLYESLGFENVQTYIQSGNVIFECSNKNIADIKSAIEKKIKQLFDFDVIVFIRTKDEFKNLIENSPFSAQDINNLYVTFLSDAPVKISEEEFKKAKAPSEEFLISDREIYLLCPDGYGRTKLSNNFFERKLKLCATTRNWKTVNKLFELAG